MTRRLLPFAFALTIATLGTAGAAQTAAAQTGGGEFHWDKAVAAGGTVGIHSINGDIKVTPSTNGRVQVVGIPRGSGADRYKVEVHESSSGIDICVLDLDADSSCDEGGMHTHDRRSRRDWDRGEIDLEVAVPTNLRVRPNTVSGDIEVTGAHGDIAANSVSGDIVLDQLHASAVDANTVSGDVNVRVDELTGNGDFRFHSVSGDVTLTVPASFGADLSMSTVSGDINTDFPVTIGNGRMNRRSLNARIGNGGRRLDVATVSGDLRLRKIN